MRTVTIHSWRQVASRGDIEYQWDFGWGKKAEGENVAVDFEFFDSYPVTLTARIKDTKITKNHSQFVDVGVNTNITIDCYDIGGDNIDNLNYMCEPVFSDSSLKDLTFAWDFGDKMSGERNSSTEEKPTHIFSKLGLYKVKLTVNDSKSINPIIITKDVVVLTTPVITLGYWESESSYGKRHRSVWINNVWNGKINKDQVDVILRIEGRFIDGESSKEYPFPTGWQNILNFYGDRYSIMDNVKSMGGVYNITLTYKIKNTSAQKQFNISGAWSKH